MLLPVLSYILKINKVGVTILISYLVGLKGCRVGIAGEVVN